MESMYADVANGIQGIQPFVFEERANLATGEPAKTHEIKRALTFGDLLAYSVQDTMKHELIMYQMRPIQQQLRASDIKSLLANTFYPIMASLANMDTVTFDLIRSAAPAFPVRDWSVDVPEERIGAARAPGWHPDGDAPEESEGVRGVRSNTLMFAARKFRHGIVTRDMLKQQRGFDTVERTMRLHAIELKQAANYYLLRGVRQANFSNHNNIPQCNGIYTEGTLSIEDADAADIAEAMINLILEDIGSYIGYSLPQIVALTNNNQMTTIRNLETGRWGIATPSTERAEYRAMLSPELQKSGLMFQRFFLPANGNPIPFLFEKDLPSGCTLFYVYNYPNAEQRLGQFELAGTPGPHMLARESEDAVDVALSFYGFTGLFPFPELKAKVINHR